MANLQNQSENPFVLSHYDDGKGKFQSHEISIHTMGLNRLDDVDVDLFGGYGETKEEAIEDFKSHFNEWMKSLIEFQQRINSGDPDVIKTVETDCLGHILEGKQI